MAGHLWFVCAGVPVYSQHCIHAWHVCPNKILCWYCYFVVLVSYVSFAFFWLYVLLATKGKPHYSFALLLRTYTHQCMPQSVQRNHDAQQGGLMQAANNRLWQLRPCNHKTFRPWKHVRVIIANRTIPQVEQYYIRPMATTSYKWQYGQYNIRPMATQS